QPASSGFAAPGFARSAEHLAHARSALVAWKRFEALRPWIEALYRVGGPVGRPHAVLLVHINRVGAGHILRHRIDAPTLRRRIVAADAAAAPKAHPQHALGIRPDAARAHPFVWRLDNHDAAGGPIDLADVVARQGCEPHVSRRRRGDTVATWAWRRPSLHFAG